MSDDSAGEETPDDPREAEEAYGESNKIPANQRKEIAGLDEICSHIDVVQFSRLFMMLMS